MTTEEAIRNNEEERKILEYRKSVEDAYARGEKVEARRTDAPDIDAAYVSASRPIWLWSECYYRIKPEPVKPRFRGIEIKFIGEDDSRPEGFIAGEHYIDIWPRQKNFVCFRFADGSISGIPIQTYSYGKNGYHIERATHVIVEEK